MNKKNNILLLKLQFIKNIQDKVYQYRNNEQYLKNIKEESKVQDSNKMDNIKEKVELKI